MADGDVSLRFRLLGEDAGASKAFGKVGGASDHLHAKMIAVGTAIGNLAAGGVVALGGLAAGAIKTGITTASSMQQASIGFETLLGSAKQAQAFVGELSKFAANTPFSFSGLVDSSRLLLGVGVAAKQVVPMLTDFGDAAGALSIQQDAFQRIMLATSQAISAGKFQAGDLNQIMTNGLPVWTLLSKAMHKTVPELRDLASHGKLLASDVLPALQAQMHKDYGGAMAAQSQTLAGLWSTFQDTLSQGMAQVLQPLIPMMQSALPGAMNFMGAAFANVALAVRVFIAALKDGDVTSDGWVGIIERLAQGIRGLIQAFQDGDKTSNGFVGAMETVGMAARTVYTHFLNIAQVAGPILLQVLNGVGDALSLMGSHTTTVGALAAAVGGMALAWKALQLAVAVWEVTQKAVMAVQIVFTALTQGQAAATALAASSQTGLNVALLANPIGLVVVALAALVAGLVYAYTHSEMFRNIVDGVFGWLRNAVVATVDFVRDHWQLIAVVMLGPVGVVIAIVTQIISHWDTLVAWFQALPGKIMAGLAALPGLILGLLKALFEKAAFLIGFELGILYNLFFVWPQRIGQALAALPGVIFRWITTAGVQGVVAFVNFHAALLARASALTAQMIGWVSSMIPQVVAWFQRLPGMVLNAIKALPDLIKGVFTGAATWLLQAGKDIVTGLINGIKSMAGHLLSIAHDLAGQVADGFKSALGISSPSKVMAEEVGRWIPPGLAMGIQQSMPVVYDALQISPPASPPGAMTRGGAAGPGAGLTVVVNMESGFVGSPQQLATALSDVIQRAKGQGLNLSFA